ncbi:MULTISPECIES: YdhK family protein [unclassified Oceanobacillus]|uniref:YdhK family protein n=1 Tax=unclassified Oceanobacillus TaxID=2630292 RepID=UPI001BE99440|nr:MULTISPECIES: YdhK family protein [unclassified Oceanobacillus]MBT2599157.1 YdhK family protein [Oceanobacillus sp. ISL-74]MBT2652075.1 YdhK family protein [Oceanobacillus sp. ISL-73]
MIKNLGYFVGVFVLLMGLYACNNETDIDENEERNMLPDNEQVPEGDLEEDNQSEKEHSDHDESGKIPKDLKEAEESTYTAGDEVTITASHMPGMEGASGKIVGAYDTTAYMISYQPTDGGEMVENHKWIIQEEINNPNKNPYQVGDEVTINAEHMEGMNGATATIEDGIETTVYMIDYVTESGEEVKNHKWVIEEELEPNSNES